MSSTFYRRVLLGVPVGIVGGATATAFYYRPHPDSAGDGLSPRPPLSSSAQLVDRSDEEEPLLMRAARFMTITAVAAFGRMALLHANNMVVKDDERYQRLVDIVNNRDPSTALITVSNHTTTLDDPTLFAALMPWSVNLTPRKVRWTVCSQEICFKNDALAAFFGAGKVMPIHRGAGIDQKLLLDLGRRVAAGGWVHLFPEGKCDQMGTLGGRLGARGRELGRLKWGAAKLVTRAPKRPIVIPIYHTGMDHFLPINRAEKRLFSWVPHRGVKMGMVVGDPVYLDDILDEYQEKCGHLNMPLRARAVSSTMDNWQQTLVLEGWASTIEEKKLLSRIARRVEEALLRLEQVAIEHHLQTHGEVWQGVWATQPIPPDVEDDRVPPLVGGGGVRGVIGANVGGGDGIGGNADLPVFSANHPPPPHGEKAPPETVRVATTMKKEEIKKKVGEKGREIIAVVVKGGVGAMGGIGMGKGAAAAAAAATSGVNGAKHP